MNKHTNEFEKPEMLTKNQARQGQTSYVFRVLIVSIVLVFILFLSAYLLAESDDNDSETASLFTGDIVAEIQLPTLAPNAQFSN
ncbi:MAG: hypothetical protein P1V21_09235 [Rhizobiaceae bacterium]|nr:hypothetical protein [Rhizobiaceae bacterium]